MALGTSIFSGTWATHHRGAAKSGMTARVRITRKVSDGKWNQATNVYEGGQTMVLFEGRARITKVARPTRREFVNDSADNQMMRVQVPIEANENAASPAPPAGWRWQSNDMVEVLTNPASPMLEGEKLFVRGWPTSSDAWLHTLHCGFNAKQDGS